MCIRDSVETIEPPEAAGDEQRNHDRGTEAGLVALDANGAADAFRAAVEASLNRMRGT